MFITIFNIKTMLTILTGAEYPSFVSSEHLYGCFFHLHYYFLHSIHLHSYLIHLYGHSLNPMPSGSIITVDLTTSEAITTQNNDKFIPIEELEATQVIQATQQKKAWEACRFKG